MRIAVCAAGFSQGTYSAALKSKPSFRKSSSMTIMAFDAILDAGLVEPNLRPLLDESAFIVGSSYGEIENTREFLKTWSNSGLARPLLFQSSLHNGTLGFLALELGMMGPSFTVSHFHLTGEKSLSFALDLLSQDAVSGTIKSCLVVCADWMAPDFLPAFQMLHPQDRLWRNSAAAVLLTQEERAIEFGIKPLAYLDSLNLSHSNSGVLSGDYSDSDALYRWVQQVRDPSDFFGKTALTLDKPDQTQTQIVWSRT